MSSPNLSHRRRRRFRWLAAIAVVWFALLILVLAAVQREPRDTDAGQAQQAHPAGPPWRHGAAQARFQIVLYADLACPFCQSYVPVLYAWIESQPDVQLIWHHLPLDIHEPVASQQAVLAECAGTTGGQAAFWSAIRWTYAQPRAQGQVPDLATHLEANQALQACIEGGDAAAAVRGQAQDALSSGITATPSLRLMDQHSGQSVLLPGQIPGDALLSAIDMLMQPAQDTHNEEPSHAQ
jgi:protein-disulfide isomerase